MISKLRAKTVATWLLVVALTLHLGAEAQGLPLETQSVRGQMLALTNWSEDVIDDLIEKLTLLPSGFWISGGTFGDQLYGVAFYAGPQGTHAAKALSMQSSRAAFYDQVQQIPLGRPSPRLIEEDWRFFLLSRELNYQIESFAEVILSEKPPGSLVKIPLDQVEFLIVKETSSSHFDQFLLERAVAPVGQSSVEDALERVDWLIEFGNGHIPQEILLLAKARLLLAQGDLVEACTTLIGFLDYSDAAFFQTFSHQDIMLIFEVFQAMELPELIFDLAALAMVLYPNEEAYVDLFHDLVRRQEEVKQ